MCYTCVHVHLTINRLHRPLTPHPCTSDGPLSRRPTAVVSSSLSSPSDSTAANPRMFLQHRASTIAEGGAHVYVRVDVFYLHV